MIFHGLVYVLEMLSHTRERIGLCVCVCVCVRVCVRACVFVTVYVSLPLCTSLSRAVILRQCEEKIKLKEKKKGKKQRGNKCLLTIPDWSRTYTSKGCALCPTHVARNTAGPLIPQICQKNPSRGCGPHFPRIHRDPRDLQSCQGSTDTWLYGSWLTVCVCCFVLFNRYWAI